MKDLHLKNLPTNVQNLRKIWDKKKVVENMTQIEAAKKLGWTQSALSHYLTDITSLNVPAIIKLANFLEVAPTDIDPNFNHDLPHWVNIPNHHQTFSNQKETVTSTRYHTKSYQLIVSGQAVVIRVDTDEAWGSSGWASEGGGEIGLMTGDVIQCIPTKVAQKWLGSKTPAHVRKTVQCMTKKTETSKWKGVSIERRSLKALDLSKFHTHLTVVSVGIF